MTKTGRGGSSGSGPGQVGIDYAVLEALQEREQHLAEAQRVAHIGSWEWDVTTNRLTWSDELYRVFGLQVQELEPTYEGWLAHVHPDDREDQSALVGAALDTHEPFESIHRIVTGSGTVRWVHSLGRVAEDGAGRPVRLYGTAQDITRHLAIGHDALRRQTEGRPPPGEGREPRGSAPAPRVIEPASGVADRARFDDRARRALERAAREGWSTAVFALEIDGLADINRQFGHVAGDEMLNEAARRLAAALRPYDTVTRPLGTVARLEGDGFLVLCENVQNAQAAGSIAARFAAAFDEPLRVGPVTVAMGIALAAPQGAGTDFDAVILDAQTALRVAKSRGPGSTEIFTEEMRVVRSERIQRIGELRHALDAGQFILHYQPKLLLANDRVAGVEALVRWEHPTLGLVAPDRFIPLAEETGLIVDLGAWVLEQACSQACRWQVRFPDRPPLVMAVNVSPRQFGPELVDTVAGVLARTGLAASALCLELTEGIVMADVASTLVVLDQLKSLGMAISIDDFGTGYSSLAYLRRFPLDELKIDRSFVDGLGHRGEDAAIVAAVVAMAHALELDVVAEGVETGEQLERLRVLGCEQVQGYYFSRPLPAEALEAFLVDEDHRAAPRRPTTEVGGGYHAEVVVIADDSPEVLQLAAVSLSAAGFDVHQAVNGRDALRLALSVKPSCVILDVRMPVLDGFGACRALRADPATAGCTIVMLTANAEALDKVEGFSAGADDYIVKPFAPRDLIGRVRAAIRRRQDQGGVTPTVDVPAR